MAAIGLISCVSRKHTRASEAQDLYRSPLFTKARQYIERRCGTWFILSAKHGLVRPRQVIEPYEETLNTKTRAEREEWAQRIWADLLPHIHAGDNVVVLAGERYRKHLVPWMTQHGCVVEVPMEGMGIGRQLQWLSRQLLSARREGDLDRLYRALERLEAGVGGRRLIATCTARQGWPRSGVYLFFEPGEHRSGEARPRVVRVGTHGVSRGSTASLWNRLRTHRGTNRGLGNHRASVFRLHVGAALAAKDPALAVSTWGVGQSAEAKQRKGEEALERAVSAHIAVMTVLWLAVEDEASPASDRAYLERNIIGLLVGNAGPIDGPSSDWLGAFSPDERIRNSGLWNLDFLRYPYRPEFLDVLTEYVLATTDKKPMPPKPIAPQHWYQEERQGVPHGQMRLFEEEEQ